MHKFLEWCLHILSVDFFNCPLKHMSSGNIETRSRSKKSAELHHTFTFMFAQMRQWFLNTRAYITILD